VIAMSLANDVRRQITSLSTAVKNARNERTSANSMVDGSRQWWKGKGADGFINEYKAINSDVDRFIRSMDNAVTNMNRLPALIDRAEKERKDEIAKEALAKKVAEAVMAVVIKK